MSTAVLVTDEPLTFQKSRATGKLMYRRDPYVVAGDKVALMCDDGSVINIGSAEIRRGHRLFAPLKVAINKVASINPRPGSAYSEVELRMYRLFVKAGDYVLRRRRLRLVAEAITYWVPRPFEAVYKCLSRLPLPAFYEMTELSIQQYTFMLLSDSATFPTSLGGEGISFAVIVKWLREHVGEVHGAAVAKALRHLLKRGLVECRDRRYWSRSPDALARIAPRGCWGLPADPVSDLPDTPVQSEGEEEREPVAGVWMQPFDGDWTPPPDQRRRCELVTLPSPRIRAAERQRIHDGASDVEELEPEVATYARWRVRVLPDLPGSESDGDYRFSFHPEPVPLRLPPKEPPQPREPTDPKYVAPDPRRGVRGGKAQRTVDEYGVDEHGIIVG
jgi:hypothetical protein